MKTKYSSVQLARLVSFTVVEAKNIVGKDAYVVAQVASRYIRTRTIHKNTNPFWGDAYVLDVDDEVKDKVLDFQVTVMEEDWLTRDKPLGHVNIPLNSMQPGKLNEQWYPLTSMDVGDVVAGMLHVIIELSQNRKNLSVRVVEGRELASRNADGTSDPFVVVKVNESVQKTQTIKKTLNPFWNKRFIFNIDNVPESLLLTCWDWDMLGGNNHLGEVSIALSGNDFKE
jgi:Ca2+-dependent lipid-binding protein